MSPALSASVVLVDDSEIASLHIARILERDKTLRVTHRFSSFEALVSSRVAETAAVVVMDVWMPGTSGLSALRTLSSSVPVVIVSDAKADSELARAAIAHGAASFVSKSVLGTVHGAVQLQTAVRNAARMPAPAAPAVVMIAGSTGAPRTLGGLIPELRGAECVLIVVQHLPRGAEEHFARWISGLGVPAQPAQHGDQPRAGRALVAPGERHFALEPPGKVKLSSRQPGDLHVPCADVAFASASWLGRRLIAVVLSGLGRDASKGVLDVIGGGGTCIAARPEECVAPSMPRNVLAASREVQECSIDSLAQQVKNAIAAV